WAPTLTLLPNASLAMPGRWVKGTSSATSAPTKLDVPEAGAGEPGVPVSAGSAASSSLSHAAASLGSMCIFQLPAIGATERGVCTAFAWGWFLSILMTKRYRRAGVPGPAAEKLVVADQASPGALRPDARLHLAGPTQCLGLGAALVGVGARPAALGAAWFCGCHACFEPCQATYQ